MHVQNVNNFDREDFSLNDIGRIQLDKNVSHDNFYII